MCTIYTFVNVPKLWPLHSFIIQLEDWYFTMQFLAGCFAYSNSAVNPIIYAGFNKNFKEGELTF